MSCISLLCFVHPKHLIIVVCWTTPAADLGGGCRGCAPNPPEMKPSYSNLKFVYLTSQLAVPYWCIPTS